MSAVQVCRTCLVRDSRMYTIANTPLHYFYEKNVNSTLNTQDGRPSVVCCICYHLLKKFYSFIDSAVRADKVLQQICDSGSQIEKQYITMMDMKRLNTFAKTPVTHANMPSNVSETIEKPNVIHEDFEIKIEEEQEGGSDVEDTPGLSETFYLELEVAPNFEIKKEKIEDTQNEFHRSSESNEDVPDFKENEIVRMDSVEKCGRGCKGALNRKKCKLEQTKSPQVPSSSKETEKEGAPVPKKCKLKQTTILPEILDTELSSKEETERKSINYKDCDDEHSNLNTSIHNKKYEYNQTNKKIPGNVKKSNLLLNTNETEKQCNYCGIKFKYQCFLTRHLRTHTGEKPFSCYCGNKFTLKSSLTQHIKRIHTGDKPYTCSYCGKKFLQKSILSRHVMVHSGEKPYTCNYCGNKYTNKSGLIKHINMHTGEKQFTCNICEKQFSYKSCLTGHVKIHTGEKPYTCDYCGKKFIQKSSMTGHILRIHSCGKVFACNYCGVSFTDKSMLRIHLTVHTDGNMFVCCYCGKKFTRNGSLAKHVLIHTSEQPFNF